MAQFMKVVIEQLRRNNWTMVEMAIVIHVWLGDGADMIRMGPPCFGDDGKCLFSGYRPVMLKMCFF